VNDLDRSGYALADIRLADHQCEHIAASLPQPSGGRAGVRDLITHPTVLRLLLHERLGGYLWSLIGRDLVAVKATLFDKSVETNWRVQWHQDRTIAVSERLAVPGYGPWSTKARSLHVEAPSEVLAQMLAIRVYLDGCSSENGPLRVIAGSHLSGKLAQRQLAELVTRSASIDVTAPRGAILLMRPLLVHSSSVASAPAHRRVLHIEFAPLEAISPLKWHTAVPLRRAA
jgi:ectoine hydroxylase-related dioxygenase (phytanoyl-CoA dioxygenase family)